MDEESKSGSRDPRSSFSVKALQEEWPTPGSHHLVSGTLVGAARYMVRYTHAPWGWLCTEGVSHGGVKAARDFRRICHQTRRRNPPNQAACAPSHLF